MGIPYTKSVKLNDPKTVADSFISVAESFINEACIIALEEPGKVKNENKRKLIKSLSYRFATLYIEALQDGPDVLGQTFSNDSIKEVLNNIDQQFMQKIYEI